MSSWRGSLVDQVLSNEVIPALERGEQVSEERTLLSAMARFDRQLDPPRKGLEDVDQAVEIEREIRGQLEQDRSQVGAELARAFHEVVDRVARSRSRLMWVR